MLPIGKVAHVQITFVSSLVAMTLLEAVNASPPQPVFPPPSSPLSLSAGASAAVCPAPSQACSQEAVPELWAAQKPAHTSVCPPVCSGSMWRLLL